jgi:hypothetical protein
MIQIHNQPEGPLTIPPSLNTSILIRVLLRRSNHFKVALISVFFATSLFAQAPPLFTEQPEDKSACLGDTTFFVARVSGDSPRTYQWQKDGKDLPGATAIRLTLQNLQQSDAGKYILIVSNAAGI